MKQIKLAPRGMLLMSLLCFGAAMLPVFKSRPNAMFFGSAVAFLIAGLVVSRRATKPPAAPGAGRDKTDSAR